MKKILFILVIGLFLTSALFAFPAENLEYDGPTSFAFEPTSARISAMGNAGLASAGRSDCLYLNPAALAQQKFMLAIPSIAVTAYNLRALVENEESKTIIEDFVNGEDREAEDLLPLVPYMVTNLGVGYNELLTTDIKLALAIKGIGIGIDLQEKIHTKTLVDSTYENVEFFPEANVVGTLAYGLRLINNETFSLDAGISAHAIYKAYFEEQTVTSICSLLDDDPLGVICLNRIPIAGGYAIPIDIGVTAGFFNDLLRASFVVNDINSVYNMKAYNCSANMLNEQFGIDLTDEETPENVVGVPFEITTPISYNLGVAFNPEWRFFNPIFAVDLVNIQDFFDTDDGIEILTKLKSHVNAGVNVKLLETLDLRVGVNGGCMSVGAGLELLGIRVEAAYYVKEIGENIGDITADALTIRINLGKDK